MSKSLEQTRNYYNGIAKGYPNLYHDEQINKIYLVKNYLPKYGKVLDLGAGAGVLNNFLDLNNLELFSFDLSFELLKLNSNIDKRKICGDAQNLSIFENLSFDTICSFSVLQDIENPIIAINEVFRVLKNKGLLILSVVKFAKSSEIISNYIEEKFELIEKVEEEKDLIFVLRKS